MGIISYFILFLSQKFESRKAAFLKTTTLTDAQQDMWKKVMTKEFISSEESGEENIYRRRIMTSYVHYGVALEGAPKVDCFLKILDNKATKYKTRQSKQQTLPRVVGRRSRRPEPLGFASDFFWVYSRLIIELRTELSWSDNNVIHECM